MNSNEMALNAAIFAISKLMEKGSTAYCIKDKEGYWNQMDWSTVIRVLHDMLKEEENG